MATIRIDVSDETLAAIERERAARGETQSEFVARALNGFLKRQSAEKAYLLNPDTDEDEMAAIMAVQIRAFPKSYWDDDYAPTQSTINR